MPRLNRVLAASAAVAATTTLLAACEKPAPKVTLLAHDTTVRVSPQTYCFDVAHCRVSKKGNVAGIDAAAGSQILVDVPRAVARKEWSVTSATLQSDGSFKTIDGTGVSTGKLQDTHSARVTVPYGAGAEYYLIVLQQNGGKSTGTWVSRVTITQ